MKKTTISLAIALMAATPAFAGTFANGGFETGTFAGWTGAGGCWEGGSYFGWSCGTPPAVDYYTNPAPVNPALFTGSPNNTIVGAGTDAITGANKVYNGSYAALLNDSVNNYGVSTLKQTVLNYTDNDIYFEWNAVLESSHGLSDSDYFSLTLKDLTTNTIIVNRGYSSAGAIGGGTSGVTWTPYGSWFSSGWVVEHVDVAALGALGHDFELTVLASDCPWGGHAGYVYLDGFAPVIVPPTSVVPEPETYAMLTLGLAVLGAIRRRKIA